MNVADAASSLSSHHPPRPHQGQSTRFFPVHTSSVIFLSPVCARPILVLAPGTRHAAPLAFWGRFAAAAKSGPIVAGSSQRVKDLDSSLKGACTLRPTDHVSVPHSKRESRTWPYGAMASDRVPPRVQNPGKSTACALHYTRAWRTSLGGSRGNLFEGHAYIPRDGNLRICRQTLARSVATSSFPLPPRQASRAVTLPGPGGSAGGAGLGTFRSSSSLGPARCE